MVFNSNTKYIEYVYLMVLQNDAKLRIIPEAKITWIFRINGVVSLDLKTRQLNHSS